VWIGVSSRPRSVEVLDAEFCHRKASESGNAVPLHSRASLLQEGLIFLFLQPSTSRRTRPRMAASDAYGFPASDGEAARLFEEENVEGGEVSKQRLVA
jgi:hypothetical protein